MPLTLPQLERHLFAAADILLLPAGLNEAEGAGIGNAD